MATNAGYPANTVEGLRWNTLFDGLFHAATYIFVIIGLILLWRSAHRAHMRWSNRLLTGSLLIGFGLFNVLEGILDHHLLRLHHVNETVPADQWIYWDIGFLAGGAMMAMVGWLVLRCGQQEPFV